MSGVFVEPGFAVVDLETTGLSPGRQDRVVEIGVVLVDAEGRVMGEWSTLVNPGRDVGPTSLHGLRPRDLDDVAVLLGLPATEVDRALDASRVFTRAADLPGGSLRLTPGDRVCFTGEKPAP